MSKNQFVWVDIPVTDLDRAIKFYSAVLGAAVEKQTHGDFSMGILPHAGEAVGGCLAPLEGDNQPSANGPLIYLNAGGRLDEAVKAGQGAGGKVVKEKHQIGPYGYRAVMLDTEGNRIALHSQEG